MSAYLETKSMGLAQVLSDIIGERSAQDEKWGEQNHPPPIWALIQAEEVGEAEKEALEAWIMEKARMIHSESPLEGIGVEVRLHRHRAELVQAAAVIVARIECLDRGTWDWGERP